MKIKFAIIFVTIPLFIFSQKEKKQEVWLVTNEATAPGEIVELKTTSILFRIDNDVRNYEISDINKVKYFRKNDKIINGLIGTGIGLSCGFLIGKFINTVGGIAAIQGNQVPNSIPGGLIFGGLIGSGIGLAITPGSHSIFIKKAKKNISKIKNDLKN